MGDILRAHLQGTNRTLARQLQDTIAHQAFGSVVVDRPAMYSYLPKNFTEYYCKVDTLPRRDRLEPVTGTRTAPATVWIPRTPAASCRDQGLAPPLLAW
jgi:hypothetical protein